MFKQVVSLVVTAACMAASGLAAEDHFAHAVVGNSGRGRPARSGRSHQGWACAWPTRRPWRPMWPRRPMRCSAGWRRPPARTSFNWVSAAWRACAAMRCSAPSRDEAIRFEARASSLPGKGDHYHLKAQGPLDVIVEKNFMKQKRGLKLLPAAGQVGFRPGSGRMVLLVHLLSGRARRPGRGQHRLAGGESEEVRLPVRADRRRLAGRRPRDGENRDWYVTEQHKFPHGMKWLADAIRAEGFKPGIWLIPYTTSDAKRFQTQPGLVPPPARTAAALSRPATPRPGRWKSTGAASTPLIRRPPRAEKWFDGPVPHDLDRLGLRLCEDRRPGRRPGVYQRFRQRGADAQRAARANVYRATLAIMKSVMGRERILLNCGGQFCSCGYCDAIRIGGDVGPDWQGMQPAIAATMSWLYTNHYCFWTDPDV